ncbi:MAG: response regulator transcription factor [Rhodospirillaceae bacterium]|nr:response regulator transcription factor [Rhodospirillaceae bacterium]
MIAASPGSSQQILLVSPVRLLRDGLAVMLQQRPRIQRVQTAESADAAIAALEQFMPTLILLDVATEDGLLTARRLAEAAEGLRILGFAARAYDHDVLAYASAGIAGFVPREASSQELFDAIDRVVNDELLCSPRIAATLFRQLATLSGRSKPTNGPGPLTDREREIARFIDDGLSNKEIALQLSIEVSTVKNHVHNILEKLRVTRRGKISARVRALHTV